MQTICKLVCLLLLLEIAFCNTLNQGNSTIPELILHSILYSQKDLFSPSIFDITRQMQCSTIKKEETLHNVHFLDHCKTRIQCPPFKNDSLLQEICSAMKTWKTCGDHLAIDTDNCLATQNISKKAIYSWKFNEGFSTYFCKNRQHFIENIISKSNTRNTLVCLTPRIRKQITACLEDYPVRVEITISNQENKLCRSYDIVEFCIRKIYQVDCVSHFKEVSKMLEDIKTEIRCHNSTAPSIHSTPLENTTDVSPEESFNLETIFVPVVTVLLILFLIIYLRKLVLVILRKTT